MGDFNMPQINWDLWEAPSSNPEVLENQFLETLRDAYIYQHVFIPTRGRGSNTPSLIDLILTNEEGMVSDLEILSPLGKSDHACISFWFNCYIDYNNKQIKRFLYDKGDYDAIKKELCIDWENELDKRITVNEKWNFIKNKILSSMEKHIPKAKMNNSKHLKLKSPLDFDTLAKVKKKHKAWKKYMNSKDSKSYKEYCRIRNQVRKLSKLARRNQERKIADDAKSNPKQFWNYVNKKMKTKPSIPNLLISENSKKETDNDREKADILNNYFSSVFTKEPDDVPELEQRNYTNFLQDVKITNDIVNKKLIKLNASKAQGPDGIHPRLIKEIANELTTPLTLLFKASIEHKSLPTDWKNATVSAIHKKGSRKQPSNYRPVSLTCISCKVLESIVRDSIIDHMKENNLFSDSQFGFIGGRSTVLQLLKVLDSWTTTLDNKGYIDCIYLDFMKAFDKVPHNRLISKLKAYGIGENIIEWIKAFLSDRYQSVAVNGTYSNPVEVTSGIPQGSVLGPLLFVIYINDMPDNINSDIYLFADDTKIFNNTSQIENVKTIQEDLNKLNNWSKKWLLLFHPQKCKVLDICLSERPSYEYHMDNIKLEHVRGENDLGIFTDNKLKFDTHIGTKVNKANYILGQIRIAFSYLDKTSLLRLYTSLVLKTSP